MDLRIISFPFKSICTVLLVIVVVLICVNSASSSTIEKQIQGCSIEGIDLGLCLNQKNSSFSIDGECCKVLNKVVQSGFNCLCLLLASSFPFLSSTPVSLPLSNCFITIPPLTLCKVFAPMPIVFPPNTPSQDKQEQPLLLPPPSPENQLPMTNSTEENSSTVAATQPPSSRNANAFVSPPNGIQTMASSPNENASSPQTTCRSHKDNEASKGSDKVAPFCLVYVLISSLLFLCLYNIVL